LELSYNTWTVVTADWRVADPLVIERGLTPGERVARVGKMSLTLHNPDGRYTPGHANLRPGFDLGIMARLKASDGVTTSTLFTGRIAAIDPHPNQDALPVGPGSPLQTRIIVLDDIAALAQARVGAFPLLYDASPADLIARLVDLSYVPIGLLTYWRLGHTVQSKLGQTAKLSDALTGKAFDTGQSLFPWAGDTWRPDQSVRDALDEVCANEGGFFTIRADGTPVFADRHARSKKINPDVSLAGGIARLSAAEGHERLANYLQVTIYPRDAASVPEILWKSGQSIKLRPGIPYAISLPYSDPLQLAAKIGARDVIPPIGGLDFTATTGTNRASAWI
jgi:hypothetical protein